MPRLMICREADLRLRKWVLKEAQLPNMVEDED